MNMPVCRIAAVVTVIALTTSGLSRADEVTYLYTNPQGTVLAEADAQGNVTQAFDYRPYGAQALGIPLEGPGYTGHVNDADTGLVYMQARYYDPEIGRFLSRDPAGISVGDTFGVNRYVYANNNPHGYVDPDGEAIQALWGAPIGALVEIGAQKLVNPRADINWKSVGVSTVLGAATGGIGSVARTAAIRGSISASQAVGRTAMANAALAAAGSAADSSVNDQSPNSLKMVTAAATGGVLSFGAAKLANADLIYLQRIGSSPVTSPEGIGGHVATTTWPTVPAQMGQPLVSVAAGHVQDLVGSITQKKVDIEIDKAMNIKND